MLNRFQVKQKRILEILLGKTYGFRRQALHGKGEKKKRKTWLEPQ